MPSRPVGRIGGNRTRSEVAYDFGAAPSEPICVGERHEIPRVIGFIGNGFFERSEVFCF